MGQSLVILGFDPGGETSGWGLLGVGGSQLHPELTCLGMGELQSSWSAVEGFVSGCARFREAAERAFAVERVAGKAFAGARTASLLAAAACARRPSPYAPAHRASGASSHARKDRTMSHTHDVHAPSPIRPLHDKVVVKRHTPEKVSPGGIIIPDAAQGKGTYADVVAVGPGKTLDNGRVSEVLVKRGDVVVLGKYSGTEIEVEGQKLLVLREEEILGVLEK